MSISDERLALLLDGAKLDAKMQTSARYKREAEETVLILSELSERRAAASVSGDEVELFHKRLYPYLRPFVDEQAKDEIRGLLAAAKVREFREGDGEVCATEGCGNAATERFESGGVGSIHCPSCIANIAAIAASPIPATGGEKE